MTKWLSETIHPAWKKCKQHSIQYSSATVNPHSRPGILELRINCVYCGCPGEAVVDVLDEDIEWKVYYNSAEADDGAE